MDKYKIEMHLHTSEVSGCSQISGAEQVRLYKEHGYAGLVITDHSGAFYTSDWLKGYHNACEAGLKYGMKVYFGLELGLQDAIEHYLMYGAKPSFLEKYPDISRKTLQEVKAIADENQILIIQSHPFRAGIRQASPTDVHGYEIYNSANGNARNRNDLSLAYWKEQGGIPTSGSDCHTLEHLGLAGIETDILPEDEAALADLLRSGAYSLIADSEFLSWMEHIEEF